MRIGRDEAREGNEDREERWEVRHQGTSVVDGLEEEEGEEHEVQDRHPDNHSPQDRMRSVPFPTQVSSTDHTFTSRSRPSRGAEEDKTQRKTRRLRNCQPNKTGFVALDKHRKNQRGQCAHLEKTDFGTGVGKEQYSRNEKITPTIPCARNTGNQPNSSCSERR
eukprot:1567576-Rhodomonas_salina.3